MDFIAIDFETASEEQHNPCELGITVVENWEIVDCFSWLIKPPCYPNFYQPFVELHNITPEMVANERTFDRLWPDIRHYFDTLIVAHYAVFDTDVLEKTLEFYNIPVPKIIYGCTVELARAALPNLPNHKLDTICDCFGIDVSNHHGAGPDSVAAARIFIQLCKQNALKDIRDVALFLASQKKKTPRNRRGNSREVTEGQIDFIEDLCRYIGVQCELPNTQKQASALIDKLLVLKKQKSKQNHERYLRHQKIIPVFEEVKKMLKCPHCDYKISYSRVKFEEEYLCLKCSRGSFFDHHSKKMVTGEEYDKIAK